MIVITGAGAKFFCAGANIQMLQDVTPTFKYSFCLHANETLQRPEQTLEAGDRGDQRALRRRRARDRARGGLRFAAKGDFKVGLPEVNLGVLPRHRAGPQRLARLLGKAKAIELMIEGRTSRREALPLGPVTKIAYRHFRQHMALGLGLEGEAVHAAGGCNEQGQEAVKARSCASTRMRPPPPVTNSRWFRSRCACARIVQSAGRLGGRRSTPRAGSARRRRGRARRRGRRQGCGRSCT